MVRCLGTCCVILRVTLYYPLTLEGTSYRPPRRCRCLWDILVGSPADCRHYTTAGSWLALLLTMVTLSTFCLRVSCRCISEMGLIDVQACPLEVYLHGNVGQWLYQPVRTCGECPDTDWTGCIHLVESEKDLGPRDGSVRKGTTLSRWIGQGRL